MVKHEFSFLKTRLTGLKRVAISASTLGNNTIVAAVANKRIRVYQVLLVAAGSVVVKFQDGAGGTDLTGPLTLAANVGFSSGWVPVGHFETTDGNLLNLNLSAGIVTGGWLIYGEV